MKLVHTSKTPVRQISEHLSFSVLPQKSPVIEKLKPIESILNSKDYFESISVEDSCPSDPSKKYHYITSLKQGLSMSTGLLSYSHGNNVGTLHFIWRLLDDLSVDDALSQSLKCIEEAKQLIPIYHTRAMKRVLFSKFGRITTGIKPVILQTLYRQLTIDSSAPSNKCEAEIDERMAKVIDMEDTDIVVDLRDLNSGRKTQYDVFWEECRKYLHEDVGTAVDDRRHGTVTHLYHSVIKSNRY